MTVCTPPEWKETYKQLLRQYSVLKRMNKLKPHHCCEHCGSTGEGMGLQMHHKYPLSWQHPDPQYQHNSPENIVTLCVLCHETYHHCYEHLSWDQYSDLPLITVYQNEIQYYLDKWVNGKYWDKKLGKKRKLELLMELVQELSTNHT